MSQKIDLVYHEGHPWHVGKGWETDLSGAGLLGQSIECSQNSSDRTIGRLQNNCSDVVFFLMGDSHLGFLHDTEAKIAAIKNLKTKKVCLCWEVIVNARFPDALRTAKRAMECFDAFGWIDEVDFKYFKEHFPEKRHFYCPVAISLDSMSPPGLRSSERLREVLFYGKYSNLGVSDLVYKERRELLSVLVRKSWFKLANIAVSQNSIAPLRNLNHFFSFGMHLPTNGIVGLTPRAFEVMAFGSVLVHPYIDKQSAPLTARIIEPWVHYIPYQPDLESVGTLGDLILSISNEDLDRISLNARNLVLGSHTIVDRARYIVESSE